MLNRQDYQTLKIIRSKIRLIHQKKNLYITKHLNYSKRLNYFEPCKT